MPAEIPTPGSDEPYISVPLTPDQQEVLAELEKDINRSYDPNAQPVDDKKRPSFPEEDEWGVPGAEGNI